jgi:hypothetical protein
MSRLSTTKTGNYLMAKKKDKKEAIEHEGKWQCFNCGGYVKNGQPCKNCDMPQPPKPGLLVRG